MKRRLSILIVIGIVSIGVLKLSQYININPFYQVGEELDVFNGVSVYYNGAVNHVEKRTVTKDGYNIGLKYQCVEFVKRYYYEYLNHKMPDSYGHAKDFFNPTVKDGAINTQRNLLQYTNGSLTKPKIHDLIVFKSTWYNTFGHVAIVTKVSDDTVFIIQQNTGPFGSSRDQYQLKKENNRWIIENTTIVGWLRKR